MKNCCHFSFWTAAIFCLASVLPLHAAERVALVIGNNAYKHGTPLVNCVNDAKAVASALKKAGFTVIVAEDASLEQMEAKALEFRRAAQGAKAAWFHYSGHGAEVKGANYLIPVDADVKEEFQVKHKAYAVDQMLGAMEEAGAPLKVVVLDCCRNNPFGRGWSRSSSVGLAQLGNTPEGTIIAFATSPGKVAEDGAGANSPFTTALVKAIATPGLDVKDIFNETGKQVLLTTNKTQQPWINSSFFDGFVLLPGGSPTVLPGHAPRQSPPIDLGSDEVKKWRELAEKGDAKAQNKIGYCYYKGSSGINKDLAEAVKWFQKAAEQGLAEAQNSLGMCYSRGLGVANDPTEAVKWYRLAAVQGHAIAQHNLGGCYATGDGVVQDLAKAVKWYRLAAEQGFPDSQFYLALCYQNGHGVSKDLAEAVRLYRKGAEQEYSPSQFFLGKSYASGEGVDKDNTISYMWMKIADANKTFDIPDFEENLKAVSKELTSTQIKKAEQMAAEWLKQKKLP